MDERVRSSAEGRKHFLVIQNPTAGGTRRRHLQSTLAALESLGASVTLRQTQGKGDAERLAAAAEDETGAMVIAAGGDGTINEVINGLMARADAERRCPLAILPLGTANVLAIELGLPKEPDRLAQLMVSGSLRTLSLGRAADRYFVAMVGAGFDAAVVAGVDLDLKRWIGKGAYAWESLRQLARFPYPTYRVALDEVWHEAAAVIVSRGRHYGGRYVIAPDAGLETDSFQVCLFKSYGRLNTLRYAAAISRGSLPRLDDFHILSARRVRIEGPEGAPLQGDGDLMGTLPVDIEICPRALTMATP